MARRRSHSSFSGRRPTFRGGRWLLGLNLAVALLLGGWFVAQPATRQAEVKRLVQAAIARDKQVSAFEVAWDIWQLYYAQPAGGRIAAGDKTHVYGGVPVAASPLRILTNRGYVVGYDDTRATPAWVAYRMRDLPKLPPAPPRPDKFVTDRRTAARVSSHAYSGSGYDRGHLAPNYAIATRYGAAAQEETFLMSNIVPQRHRLNAGLWRELEARIATNYPARYEEVWVLTGPIIGAQPRTLRGGIPIPEAFWLVVVDEHEGRLRTLAFIVPHEGAAATAARYVTSIDEIERRTGLDVLPELDDASESAIEQRAATAVW
jgi:endonuclease G